MVSTRSHLIVALLALFSPLMVEAHSVCMPLPRIFPSSTPLQEPATKQEPTVSIQPTSGATSRGVPPVVVTVDNSRVHVGETVRFTLTPASLVTNPKYSVTIDFGDGTRQEVNRTSVTHQYRATGHYKVYASVVGSERISGTGDQNRPVQQIPRVSLSATPAPVVAGRPVTFTAQLTSRYPNIKYRFVFGDGAETDWQDNPVTLHLYPASGTYLAYVDIGAIDNGIIKQLAGSMRQPIQVTSPPLGPIELSVSPMPVEAEQPVTFTARVASNDPNIRYRFAFGDRSVGGWQVTPQITHVYSSTGTFPASVDIGVMNNRGISQVGSARIPVQVTPPPPATVNLIVNPASVEMGKAVSFSARAVSRDPNLKYRFVFGDGASEGWQDSPQASHRYAGTGSYPAYVEVGRLKNGRINKVATSSRTQISVMPAGTATPTPSPGLSPSPSSTVGSFGSLGGTSPAANQSSSAPAKFPIPDGLRQNWWKFLLALLIILSAYKLMKSLVVSVPDFRAFPDPGGAEVRGGAQGLSIDCQVILRPNIAEGEYLVFTDGGEVVKNLRREDV